ncbi:hypothetical protein D9756_001966 [Leucocoprinus leucothites]|uniref:Sterol regulatory element-binding protein cleavage-activating protein n=1 Tax=Leucocoprinus leucothites TaxID=201217 RepID=A0A8H5LI54_9AGAR|nr:hypothetical protein D9756_001966 [Leucoagaricus leucothites]
MLGYALSPLQSIRFLVQHFFLQFGLHCATHQIRVILISCVVITSLFYPALSIYSSSQPKSLSVIDAFTPQDPASGLRAQRDLVDVWAGHDALRKHEDSVSIAKCGGSQTLRVERLLIAPSKNDDDDDALNHRMLLSTLELERRLGPSSLSDPFPCLKRPDGTCFVISPLAFWDYDEDTLLSDTNILDTLSRTKNISGVLITPTMVLAGRGSDEHHVTSSRFDYASHLAITYFFPEKDCVDDTGHQHWREAVPLAASKIAEVNGHSHPPTIIALEYDINRSQNKGWTAFSAFLYVAYFGFFVYVAWSVRRMDAVHDRLGVTFTALVEIAVSTVTSLSVCALVGFQVTLVPWELLPIVIAFVGAENMFNLVDAVGKTSVTLSVKQRIAEGLSYAGTSNTLKVVCYNWILGIIAVAGSGAVRQFCIFAIVVLVAHWFLAHTFFMAVLSIDIQRLELEELLRRDTALAPPLVRQDSSAAKQPRSGWVKLGYALKKLLKGRAGTNVSLVLLLAITATLYYTTYSTNVGGAQAKYPTPIRAVTRKATMAENLSPEWQIWKTLIPEKMADTEMLHLRIEQPLVVTLIPDSSALPPNRSHRPRGQSPFRSVIWLFKIMVLPIAATTGLLWLLLLYLLKNAELLEAQKHHPDADAVEEKPAVKALDGQISFTTLPRAFSSDVELIAASQDGRIVVSVGLHNEITVWNLKTQTHTSIDATNLLLRAASTSYANPTLTSIAVDKSGEYFAVGTGTGVIAVWRIDKTAISPFPHRSFENSPAGVTDLQFGNSLGRRVPNNRRHSRSEPSSPDSGFDDTVVLLVIFDNGVVAKWTMNESATVSYLPPTQDIPVSSVSLVHVAPNNQVLIAYSFIDGSLELVETGNTLPLILHDYQIRPGSQGDCVSHVHACRSDLNGTSRLVVATTTESGVVSLWDGSTGECISVLEEARGRVTNLRVSPVKCETCHFCGQLPLESISIAFSIDYVVRFFKLFLKDQTRRCSCTRTQLKHMSSSDHMGRRSRSNSGTSSQMGSPRIPRARLATAFEASAFPVSGHGIHSRRASEKENGRRSSELLVVPLTGDDHDGHLLNPLDGAGVPIHVTPSFWRNAVAILVTEITCERGGWDVLGQTYVGIRRKPRSQGKTQGGAVDALQTLSSSYGLTRSTLERWELWMFDPALSQIHSSTLASLTQKPPESKSAPSTPTSITSSSESVSRLPFTRVTPLHIASSRVLAGFGNTIGVFHLTNG